MTAITVALLLVALALDVYALWEFRHTPRVESPSLQQEVSYYRGHVIIVRHRGASVAAVWTAMSRHVVLIEEETEQFTEVKR